MRISDWSSDVCSSDLLAVRQRPRSNLKSHRLLNLTGSLALFSCMECDHNEMGGAEMSLRSKLAVLGLTATLAPFGAQAGERDRKSVVWGKSGSVRVESGGRRILKKKTTDTKQNK